jgi:hypothetical protein
VYVPEDVAVHTVIVAVFGCPSARAGVMGASEDARCPQNYVRTADPRVRS